MGTRLSAGNGGGGRSLVSQRDVGDGTEGERCEHSRSGLGEVSVQEEMGTQRTGAGEES